MYLYDMLGSEETVSGSRRRANSDVTLTHYGVRFAKATVDSKDSLLAILTTLIVLESTPQRAPAPKPSSCFATRIACDVEGLVSC